MGQFMEWTLTTHEKWSGSRQRDDLKGCPFCGTAALQQVRLADNATNMQYRILCGNPFCHLECDTGPCASLHNAEERWEERAPETGGDGA